jgi:hypothetical protein
VQKCAKRPELIENTQDVLGRGEAISKLWKKGMEKANVAGREARVLRGAQFMRHIT